MPVGLVAGKPMATEPARRPNHRGLPRARLPAGISDPQGKAPSTFTIELRKGASKATLPFEDQARLRGSEERLHRPSHHTRRSWPMPAMGLGHGQLPVAAEGPRLRLHQPVAAAPGRSTWPTACVEVVHIYQVRGYDPPTSASVKG